MSARRPSAVRTRGRTAGFLGAALVIAACSSGDAATPPERSSTVDEDTAARTVDPDDEDDTEDPDDDVLDGVDRPEPARPIEPVELDAPTDEEWFTTGFLEFPMQWNDDPDIDSGFSMHVAAWPFQQTYPGPEYQSGLPGTWMFPESGVELEDSYSTIEGGLGWWRDTRFATETPKFIMGGVARDFVQWANGPGAGGGYADVDLRDWDEPQGKYGVAQLSPYVLWAPDGLNLAPGTNGGLFGYGYHPLPIIDEQPTTAGQNVVTGDNSWTLFLDTANFRGPITFFVPNFFSQPALDDPAAEGVFFDTSRTGANQPIAMETQVIPAASDIDDTGTRYARSSRTQFPANGGDDRSSIIVADVTVHGAEALAGQVEEWFDGGPAPDGMLDATESETNVFEPIDAEESSTYVIIHEGLDGEEEYPIDWSTLTEVDTSDPTVFRYRWNLDIVERDGDRFVLPEYYVLDGSSGEPRWTPVSEAEVPESTGLLDHEFDELGERADDEPYTTPLDDPSGWSAAAVDPWTSPGPVAGPFEAELGDGSVVTYHWYRFVDQPSIRFWGFDTDQLDRMQERVEAIHREWGPDGRYLPTPDVGEPAALAPAVLVTPPAGLEVGYVPIVTRQEAAT